MTGEVKMNNEDKKKETEGYVSRAYFSEEE